MKYISVVILIFVLSCKQSTKNSFSKESLNGKYIHLLSKFKDISFDTLSVFSMGENIGIENYKYAGVQLDSLDVILFPKKIAQAHFADPPGLFACYKFKIDSSRLALIARTPAEYYPSSIKLFIYTIGKDTLIESVELAQYIGDAGELMDVNSWLIKDPNNTIKALVWNRESLDNSVENEKDTTISKWDHFSIYNISNDSNDSLGADIKKLPIYFRNLLMRKIK